MKTIVDQWGDPVKPWSLHLGLNGGWYQITDLAPEDRFAVGAVFEGGDPEEDGDYFTPDAFGFEIHDTEKKPEDAGDWRQEAFKLWCE
mgnify:CR=1 FL=1